MLAKLAPDEIILVPMEVNAEIEYARQNYPSVPAVVNSGWASLTVLNDDEALTELLIKAEMGGTAMQHLGECAVIACAHHRNLIAVLDDRDAIEQADAYHVPTIDTLWIVIEAYVRIFERERSPAVQVVDDLLATGMFLPISSGESLFSWAYEQGSLP